MPLAHNVSRLDFTVFVAGLWEMMHYESEMWSERRDF